MHFSCTCIVTQGWQTEIHNTVQHPGEIMLIHVLSPKVGQPNIDEQTTRLANLRTDHGHTCTHIVISLTQGRCINDD